MMKIYVGNLSFSTSSNELEDLFTEFGEVSKCQIISDRETGRSKGFGFVEMSNDGDARTAISALNDKDHDGRNLKVNEARPREDRPRRW